MGYRVVHPLRIGFVLPRLLAAIASGERFRDKFAVAAMLGRGGLLPLSVAARRLGLSVPDPGRLITAYTCRSDGLLYRCPGGGGPYFLFCDPRHDPGVRASVDALDGGTFIDVGAHVGFFSLPAARRLRGRGQVIAIEPHPVRLRFLSDNINRNQLTNITALPFAIGDHEGTATLYDLDPGLMPHPRDVSLAQSRGKTIPVLMRTIDGLCDELSLTDVALVKIDVEGFEPQVLAGMETTLSRWKPKVVFEALTLASLTASAERLQSHGYVVRQVDSTNYLANP